MNRKLAKPRTNEGDYLYRSFKKDLGIEPKSFLPRTSLRFIITRCLNF